MTRLEENNSTKMRSATPGIVHIGRVKVTGTFEACDIARSMGLLMERSRHVSSSFMKEDNSQAWPSAKSPAYPGDWKAK